MWHAKRCPIIFKTKAHVFSIKKLNKKNSVDTHQNVSLKSQQAGKYNCQFIVQSDHSYIKMLLGILEHLRYYSVFSPEVCCVLGYIPFSGSNNISKNLWENLQFSSRASCSGMVGKQALPIILGNEICASKQPSSEYQGLQSSTMSYMYCLPLGYTDINPLRGGQVNNRHCGDSRNAVLLLLI